ncbi:MAG: 16S rRNA (guanine(966)-N(2))-methyltransferase RsmD [Anaerolineales bacterium]|nr:16S rRNA (guanine(966)-N(2))-methyltransferase RsmD [Anaerolineales bacterium]MDW8226720.1 16S rRNA (guanine(966)-N(2))-methyltransferase RsmD [Anaerolineales bacterium]
MSLRVISGKAKGRKLKSVPGDTTRPVTDLVKQALFNILGEDVVDSTWWDVFGGTGAIGIEALSRGAAFVRFSELNRLPIETIKANLELTGFTDQAEIRRGDAFAMLASPPDRQFDYVYIAPPQYQELWSKALRALDANPGWLAEDAWVIVQIHPREAHPVELKQLVSFDKRKYGSTLLIFYEKK